MRRLSLWCKAYLFLTAFSILGTLLSRFTGTDPGWIAPVAAFLTLACGVAAVYTSYQSLSVLFTVLAIGLAAELLGIYTGLPFGRYEYTGRWWPTIPLPGDHRLPLLLPFAWAMVVGASFGLASRFPKPLLIAPILAAVADLLMEPVMTHGLGYWKWLEKGPLPGGAPVLNLVGWLLVSAVALIAARPTPTSRPEPAVVYFGHLAMTLAFWVALP